MKTLPNFFRVLGTLLIFLGTGALGQERSNLIMNGGFETGIQFWRGDGKVERLPDGSRVCEIDAAKNRMKDITQEFRMKDLAQVEIVFRARSIKYTGGQLRISVHQVGGGSIIYNRPIPDDGSWGNFRVQYTRPNKEDRRELIIATLLGTGQVQIDDVEVRAPGTVVSDDRPAKPSATPPPVPAPTTPVPAPPMVAVIPAATPVPPAPVAPPMMPSKPVEPASVSTDPGSFPAKYRDLAEDMMKTVWDWKASGGNFQGVTVFKANGDAIEGKKNGDWRIGEDGTFIYRRGGDLTLIWHLKKIDADRLEGQGVGGAAVNRTCSLTRRKAR